MMQHLTVETRYGLMNILKEEGDIVSRFLLRYGEWGEFEIQFVSANIPASAKIADVGAFVGSFGISLSQTKPADRILFVEANPEVIPLLNGNVERNCQSNYQVLDNLIFPKGHEARIVKRHGSNQGSTSYTLEGGGEIVPEAIIPARSIDLGTLLREHGPFDLLKLDIEGLELDVLKDIKTELAGGAISVWAECNETFVSLRLAEFLLSCGLRVHYFAFPSFNPDNFRGDKEAIFPMAYEAGLYASRETPIFPEALRQAGCLCHEIMDGESLRQALWRTPRWCPPELLARHPEEIVAIAVRYLHGERYATFLMDTAEATDNPVDRRIVTPIALTEALDRIEGQLRAANAEREAQAELIEQLNLKFSLEREKSLQHVRATDWALALAEDRLKLLQEERKRSLAPLRQVRTLISDRFERMITTLRRSAGRHPLLYRAARMAQGRSQRLAQYLYRRK